MIGTLIITHIQVTKSPTDTVATRATDDTFERTDFEYDMEEGKHMYYVYLQSMDVINLPIVGRNVVCTKFIGPVE